MNRACVTLVFLLAAACDFPMAVGMVCGSNSDCEPGQGCNNSAPKGYCTRGCTSAGDRSECPNQSVCANFEGGPDGGGAGLACAAICTATTDCRDQYECAVAGTVKACTPLTK